MTDPDLVPEDFDLDAALSARSTSDGTGMPDCPNCGPSGDIRPKSPDKPSSPDRSQTNYYCKTCGQPFFAQRGRQGAADG